MDRFDVGTEKELEPITYPYYHLGSIIYYTSSEWIASINGITITKATNKPTNELFITSIQPSRVSLVWKAQDKRLLQEMKKKEKIAPRAPNIVHRLPT